MDVQIVPLAVVPVVMFRHRGPYDLRAEFERLWEWSQAQGVPIGRFLGMFWDNPDHVSPAGLRSAACVEVPADFQLGERGGLPLELGEIAAGPYAMTRYIGLYDGMEPVWSELTRRVEVHLRRTIGEGPAIEIYVNDASDTAPQDLITDLYLPVL